MTERLDKLIASQGKLSRSDVKKMVKSSRVTVDGAVVKSADIKVDADKSVISVDGKALNYKKNIYIMLNKPQGVISASNDKTQKTVVDLVPPELYRDGLFPAGRLDGDTVGFVLITDDGDFAHRILSPKNHIMKTYHATLRSPLTEEDISAFKNGIELSDGTLCLEAEVRMLEKTDEPIAEVKICEGKYHQVKRMFAALGNKVLYLKRVRMGGLDLDESLEEGQCREITAEELLLLSEKN
ncbi:MAG: rRNA pseudouridine synthase [Clostridia bacterium]|nr:rRNA pseudouridine synthase [Clostridia bacterium]MBQ1995466.1 rRNA pseudouridine synthase [Clostridia bacterium]MBQ5904948.1 rRNA pseudouridine synthase [Clostridia bacterium]